MLLPSFQAPAGVATLQVYPSFFLSIMQCNRSDFIYSLVNESYLLQRPPKRLSCHVLCCFISCVGSRSSRASHDSPPGGHHATFFAVSSAVSQADLRKFDQGRAGATAVLPESDAFAVGAAGLLFLPSPLPLARHSHSQRTPLLFFPRTAHLSDSSSRN